MEPLSLSRASDCLEGRRPKFAQLLVQTEGCIRTGSGQQQSHLNQWNTKRGLTSPVRLNGAPLSLHRSGSNPVYLEDCDDNPASTGNGSWFTPVEDEHPPVESRFSFSSNNCLSLKILPTVQYHTLGDHYTGFVCITTKSLRIHPHLMGIWKVFPESNTLKGNRSSKMHHLQRSVRSMQGFLITYLFHHYPSNDF